MSFQQNVRGVVRFQLAWVNISVGSGISQRQKKPQLLIRSAAVAVTKFDTLTIPC